MTTSDEALSLATRQIHAGYVPGTVQNTAVVPIYQSAAFEFENFEAAKEIFALRRTGNLYGRAGNPTAAVLEQRIADLDGGAGALATGSGQSAVAVALLALVRNGQHIVASSSLYGGTVDLLTDTFPDFGIDVTLVDPLDPDAWQLAVREDTRAFFVESVSNPVASLPDLRVLAETAHANNIPLVVDNTVPTPVLLRPIEHGADVVVYSATKFLGGHGTSLAGLIVDSGNFDFGARPERWALYTQPYERFGGIVFNDAFTGARTPFLTLARARVVHDLGPSLSPFNAFQILQGLETLDLRISRHTDSALQVARFLDAHPAVTRVHHPGLPGHPQHGDAGRLFPDGIGSVFSFDLAAEPAHVGPFIDSLEIFRLVANIGDARSLVIHPATTTHSRFTAGQFAAAGIGPTTIRLSIGLEAVGDLIADLRGALDAVAAFETSGTARNPKEKA
ncbi:O-acetylhomoserine aminocarboxypropyltransferase/cysteine synthase family protein [Paenarthrobacter sp. NPDC056912]|uniref:O-acetylhomoserine aminocarboxypropyltransferase/cysteine synthase family protein n=1 Tax=Paenarthrobacter sp. NPDC056912 TaxID=3345965 RepID=UPI00366E42F6